MKLFAPALGLLTPSSTGTPSSLHISPRGTRRQLTSQADDQTAQLSRVLSLSSKQRLREMRSYADDWDGYGSSKPQLAAIGNAEARLNELVRGLAADRCWREPHISSNEDGEITFEWWSNSRKVTMYFGANEVEVIKVWGANIETEMDVLSMKTVNEFQEIWAWLYG